MGLPQDPAVPLVGIYPKEVHSYHKDIGLTAITAALFIISNTRDNLGVFQLMNG